MTICQLYDTYAWDIQPKWSLQKTNLPWMRLVLTQTISYLDASYAGVMLRTSGFIIPHLPPTKSRESTFGWRFWSLRTSSITGSWTSATLKRISNCKWSQSILLETHSNQIFKANYLNFHDNMQDLNFNFCTLFGQMDELNSNPSLSAAYPPQTGICLPSQIYPGLWVVSNMYGVLCAWFFADSSVYYEMRYYTALIRNEFGVQFSWCLKNYHSGVIEV